MSFINIVLWLWQLPQNLIALFIIFILNSNKERVIKYYDHDRLKVYFVKRGVFKCGISLGNYIILSNKYLGYTYKYTEKTAKHEHGHQKQSNMFGWFYLIVIGLPSLINNIISRIYKKDEKWYYNRYPENWADKLGNVHRYDSV